MTLSCGREDRGVLLEDFMKNFYFVFIIVTAFWVTSCSSTINAVGNSQEAQVIVERIDGYTDVEITMYLHGHRYQDFSIHYGSKYYVNSSQKLLGTAFWKVQDGKYTIWAEHSYKTGKKELRRGEQVDEWATVYSTRLTFNIKKGNKHVFYIEYEPNPKSIRITEGTDIGNHGEFVDSAISNAYKVLSEGIQDGAKIAIVNIATQNRSEGEYIISELSVLFVNSRRFSLVDRRSLDAIRAEQRFQMTGEVDDNSVVSIGKMLGAEVVITGSIEGQGDRRRLRIKALDVRTAEILGMTSDRL